MKRGTPFNVKRKFLPISSGLLSKTRSRRPIFTILPSTISSSRLRLTTTSYKGCSGLSDKSLVHQSSGFLISISALNKPFSISMPFALNSDLSGDSTEKKVEKSSVVLYLSTRAVIDSVTAPSELCFCDILKSEISAPHAVSRYTSSRMPDAGAKGAKSQPK